MKGDMVKGAGFIKSEQPRKVFLLTNGRSSSGAFRDFPDSPYNIGDYVDMYRVTKKQVIEVLPDDVIIRRAGTHEIV